MQLFLKLEKATHIYQLIQGAGTYNLEIACIILWSFIITFQVIETLFYSTGLIFICLRIHKVILVMVVLFYCVLKNFIFVADF